MLPPLTLQRLCQTHSSGFICLHVSTESAECGVTVSRSVEGSVPADVSTSNWSRCSWMYTRSHAFVHSVYMSKQDSVLPEPYKYNESIRKHSLVHCLTPSFLPLLSIYCAPYACRVPTAVAFTVPLPSALVVSNLLSTANHSPLLYAYLIQSRITPYYLC